MAAKTAARVNGRINASHFSLGRYANIAPTTMGAAQTSAPRMAAIPQFRIARTLHPPGARSVRATGRNARGGVSVTAMSRPAIWYVLSTMDREFELALV